MKTYYQRHANGVIKQITLPGLIELMKGSKRFRRVISTSSVVVFRDMMERDTTAIDRHSRFGGRSSMERHAAKVR